MRLGSRPWWAAIKELSLIFLAIKELSLILTRVEEDQRIFFDSGVRADQRNFFDRSAGGPWADQRTFFDMSRLRCTEIKEISLIVTQAKERSKKFL